MTNQLRRTAGVVIAAGLIVAVAASLAPTDLIGARAQLLRGLVGTYGPPPPDATKTWDPDTPISVHVNWPTPPSDGLGFVWMYSFELSAYTTDMDKLTYSWVENGQSVSSSVQMMDTPKFFWRCSFGTFAESGTDTVDNAASVTWRAPFPLKDLQDSVDISCTADDVAFIGEGEGGSRDDATASDSMSLPIRYPKTLTISHRWWTQADAATRPKDPGNAFGFFNIMHVDDNRGHPWAGMYIEQDMLRDDNGVYTATNGHPARPFGNPPLPREGDLVWWKDLNTTTTDANGDLYDLVQGESEQAYGTTPHIFKRVYVVSPDYGLTKYYWNPVPRNPACTSPHADQYSPLGPP